MLTVKARPLASGYVKAKTGDTTTQDVYDKWYQAVYMPTATPVIPEQQPFVLNKTAAGAVKTEAEMKKS